MLINVSYSTKTICLLRVLAPLAAILMELNYKGYTTKVFQSMHKSNTLIFKNACFKMYKNARGST